MGHNGVSLQPSPLLYEVIWCAHTRRWLANSASRGRGHMLQGQRLRASYRCRGPAHCGAPAVQCQILALIHTVWVGRRAAWRHTHASRRAGHAACFGLATASCKTHKEYLWHQDIVLIVQGPFGVACSARVGGYAAHAPVQRQGNGSFLPVPRQKGVRGVQPNA